MNYAPHKSPALPTHKPTRAEDLCVRGD